MPNKNDNNHNIDDFGCCPIPSCVEARTLEHGRDRRAFASRKIRVGEVILRNAPTAHALLPTHKQERCARCLSTRRKDGAEKQNLMRCGGCKQIWYCSRDCQKEDFRLHKFECKQSSILFPSEQTNGGSIDNARLLVRNFLALRTTQKGANGIDNTQCCKLGSRISCGVKHFDSLLQYDPEIPLDPQERMDIQCASRVLWNQRKRIPFNGTTTIHERLPELQEQLEADLRKFRANNFGVTDAMARVVASAVYPLGALLNHSCAPNCLLRYDFGKSEPIMEIVAAQDIDEGEELTHSYVELVSPLECRRQSLRGIFGFDCQCNMCVGESTRCISLPRDHGFLSPIELSRWVLQNYNPSKQKSARTTFVSVDKEIIFQPPVSNNPKYRAMVEEANAKQQQAQYLMVTGNLIGELALLEEAVLLLESSLAQKSNDSSIPLSLDLYKARCTRFGSLIVAEESMEAMIECEHIVAYLCLALNHVPNHSLLGLQLFTLGDIYEAQGKRNEACTTYSWARKVLRVSQGNDSDMVILLNEKLG